LSGQGILDANWRRALRPVAATSFLQLCDSKRTFAL
jgi:hypothetical protein